MTRVPASRRCAGSTLDQPAARHGARQQPRSPPVARRTPRAGRVARSSSGSASHSRTPRAMSRVRRNRLSPEADRSGNDQGRRATKAATTDRPASPSRRSTVRSGRVRRGRFSLCSSCLRAPILRARTCRSMNNCTQWLDHPIAVMRHHLHPFPEPLKLKKKDGTAPTSGLR
jgi:hypothetical protein